MIKTSILKLIDKLGYTVEKKDKDIFQIELYKQLYSAEALENKQFYNLGTGDFFHPYWTNVDYFSDWYKVNDEAIKRGINHDFFTKEKLPIKTDSAEIVYSSHIVEHLTDDAVRVLFDEAYRILKKKGVFRVTMPDIDLHYWAYKQNDRTFFYWQKWYEKAEACERIFINKPLTEASIEQLFLQRFAAATTTLHADGVEKKISDTELQDIFVNNKYEDALNLCTSYCTIEKQQQYPGNHMNWWNMDKTTRMLKQAGFNIIYKSGYGQSRVPVLRNTVLFDNTHPKISLYVEAIKE